MTKTARVPRVSQARACTKRLSFKQSVTTITGQIAAGDTQGSNKMCNPGRLLGSANESDIKIDNLGCRVLLDSGSPHRDTLYGSCSGRGQSIH